MQSSVNRVISLVPVKAFFNFSAGICVLWFYFAVETAVTAIRVL